MNKLSLDLLKSMLYKKHSIIDFINLNDYHHPADLYEKVLSCKKESFLDNERIIFVYSKNKINFLLEILNVIDIPDFFVILLVPADVALPESTSNISILQFKDSYVDNNRIFDIPENHCIYPWINVQIDNLGDISPCCMFQPTSSFSVNNNSIKEAYLSSEYNSLRDKFRNNLRPTECQQCWNYENSGGKSMRVQSKFKLQDLYYKIDYSENNLSNLQMLDLKLGNICNLSCRICHENASSSIIELKLKNNQLSDPDANKIKILAKWATSEIVNDQILELSANLLYLDIYGGEPFMNKPHFELLRKLIDLGVANKISIDYNSNGTFYSDKFFDYWKEFKKVKISFSIDDIESRFEFQRAGANWDSVVKNIQRFNNRTSSKFITDLFPTVNVQNVYYLPELIEWANTQNFSQGISFNILNKPEPLAINNLPHYVKEHIAKKLSPYPELNSIINFMFTDPTANVNALKYLETIDLRQSQNYFQIHDEFAKILTNTLASNI